MQTLPTISVLSVSLIGLVACATTPPDPPSGGPPDPPVVQDDLEIRHTKPSVAGNLFQCTGTWPSSLTPCGYAWASQPHTAATSDLTGALRLVLHRVPMPVDGGASTVYIDLSFDAGGAPTATALEATTRPPLGKETETSTPIAGWIDPIAMSAVTDERQAGAFSLTFTWGSISGTYDTAPAR